MLAGMLSILFTAYMLGRRERKRLGVITMKAASEMKSAISEAAVTSIAHDNLKRPNLRWLNLILTITVMVILIMGLIPIPVLFLIGFVLASIINYPNIEQQRERIMAHAGNAIMVVTLVFAAGIFTGIFSGTKMVDAIANSLVAIIPESLGSFFPIVVALTSMPFTFILSNDAYYFGVLPILAEAGTSYGATAVEIARASVLGQPIHFLSPLVASTLLLVGMVKKDLGEIQKYAFVWALICSLVMIVISVITGAII